MVSLNQVFDLSSKETNEHIGEQPFYKITYLGAVHAIKYMLDNATEKGGDYTPAQLLGVDTITKIEGVSEMTICR